MMNVLPVRIPDDLYEKLQTLSRLCDDSMAEIIRKALVKEIQLREPKIEKKLKYANPLKELLKDGEREVKKLKTDKYYYPKFQDDELLYLRPWKKKKI